MTDRAQVYTLEGIIAALVVMTGLLFAIQATTATPQAAGIANPQAQQQDKALVRGLLTAADDQTLREAVLFWDPVAEEFHCAPDGSEYYPAPNSSKTSDGGGALECPASTENRSTWVPPNEFGKLLDYHLGSGYSFNVFVTYHEGDLLRRQRMVYQGQPGDGVVRATTSVALSDGQVLYGADEEPSDSGDTVGHSGFYGLDDASGGDLHNVYYVEVVVWRG